MKTKNLKIAGLAFAAILMTINLNAQRPGGQGNGKGQGYGLGRGMNAQPELRQERMAAYLELTEEQQAQMTDMQVAHQKKMLPLRNEMNELRARKQTLITAEDVDLNAVNKNIDKQTAVQAKMKKEQAKHQMEVKSILTDEQQFKMMQLRKKGKGQRGNGQGRPGRCNGGNPGPERW